MRGCQLTANRITAMIPGKKVDHKNGVLYYHVGNFTNDLTKHEQIITFKDLFQFYEHENYPIRYCSTANPDEAYFKIYFVDEEGKIKDENGVELFKCPLTFENDVLATAYAPYGGKWEGHMFINDRWYWTMKENKELKREILPTLIHEISHNFNLDHNTNPRSVLYWADGKDQKFLKEDSKLIHDLYKDDRIAAVQNSHSAQFFVEHVRSIKTKAKRETGGFFGWLRNIFQ